MDGEEVVPGVRGVRENGAWTVEQELRAVRRWGLRPGSGYSPAGPAGVKDL